MGVQSFMGLFKSARFIDTLHHNVRAFLFTEKGEECIVWVCNDYCKLDKEYPSNLPFFINEILRSAAIKPSSVRDLQQW